MLEIQLFRNPDGGSINMDLPFLSIFEVSMPPSTVLNYFHQPFLSVIICLVLTSPHFFRAMVRYLGYPPWLPSSFLQLFSATPAFRGLSRGTQQRPDGSAVDRASVGGQRAVHGDHS